MSVNQKLEKIIFDVAEIKGNMASLIDDVAKLRKSSNGRTSLKAITVIISATFAGTFSWLTALTYLLIRR